MSPLLLQSCGHNYLFTILDRFTRWLEAIPMVDISSESCSRAFLAGWLSHFGLSKDITSDRGRQFVSDLWSQPLNMIRAKAVHTTAYHPQANVIVEWFHRQLKASLKAKLNTSNWFNKLALVLLRIRTLAFLSHLKSDIARLHPTPTKKHISNRAFHIPPNLMECTQIFMHLDCHLFPLDCPYSGPYRVLKLNDKYFTLDLIK